MEHLLRSARHEGNHHRTKRDSSGQSREVSDRTYKKLPRKNADDNRGQAVQYVREKTHGVGEGSTAFFGEVEARANSDRQPDRARRSDNHERTHDRIRHSASRLTRTAAGDVGEECDIERRDSANHQVNKDRCQRNYDQQDANDCEGGCELIHQATMPLDGEIRLRHWLSVERPGLRSRPTVAQTS